MKFLFKAFPAFFSFFLSHIPPKILEKKGQKFAINLFNKAKETIPAYQNFLSKRKFTTTVTDKNTFSQIPIMDKQNYINQYPLIDRIQDRRISDKYLIDSSSGYKGKPLYWPRTKEEDKEYPFYMGTAYKQFYGINHKSTLMIITLSLGSWIGGEKISWASREIAINNNYPFSVITPGLRINETIEIIQQFKNLYEQIVLVGYPPFIKRIIDEGESIGIDWKKIKIKIGLGGEGYSENWREYIRQKIGMSEKDLLGIAGGYGASDAGMSIGREYPLTVLIRKLAYKDKRLAQDLFGVQEPLPTLCQYNPSSFYLEEVNSELIISTNAGVPIIRYNIHDRGGVIPFTKMINILNKHHYSVYDILIKDFEYKYEDIWHLPFFYCFGRSEGTTYYGIVIYPEYIKEALENDNIGNKTTNNFKLITTYDHDHNQILEIHIELIPQVKPNNSMQKQFQKIIFQKLSALSTEFKELYSRLPDLNKPEVYLHIYQDSLFKEDIIKYKYQKIL